MMVESIVQPDEPALLRFFSYIRYPFALIAGIIITGIACSLFTILSLLLRSRTLDNWVIWSWGWACCFVHGIRVKVEGAENIPKGGCLLLFNHASLFDIPIMYGHIKKDFRYGAKAELFKVPIFGSALKVMGALPIHRARRGDVLKLYENSVQRLHNGESFALAPEGTRQREPEIGKFKTGPFIFGIQAQVPLVPVVIKGALETLSKDDWIVNRGRWHRYISLRVLPPINTSGYTQDDIPTLQDIVREKMVQAHHQMN